MLSNLLLNFKEKYERMKQTMNDSCMVSSFEIRNLSIKIDVKVDRENYSLLAYKEGYFLLLTNYDCLARLAQLKLA